MNDIVHPLADELGDLVENDPEQYGDDEPERDTSWRWMAAIVIGVALLAWLTR